MDFESWYSEYLKRVSKPRDRYLADLLYHAFHENGTDLQRLRFGYPGWAAWLVLQLLRPRRRPVDVPPALNPEFLLLPLPTGAHEETLLPVTLEIASEKGLVLNPPNERWNRLKQPVKSVISHGEKPTYDDLARAVRCARAAIQAAHHAWGPRRRVQPSRFLLLVDRVLQASLWERSPQVPLATGAIFLTYELSPISKAACIKAIAAGHRVIHIMHGQRLPSYQVTVATDLVLFSKVDEPWFRKRVDPHVRIWAIGHPRLEETRKQVGLPPTISPNRMPRIAFFSQPFEGDYDRGTRKCDWALLAGLEGRAEVRFRLHPRESKADALHDLAELGLDFVTLSEAGMIEDLQWCDAVASSWSTVSMEAAVCGRGIFWTCTTPERYEASQELRDHEIGILIESHDDWAPPLCEWQTSAGWAKPIVVPDHRLRELGMIGDTDMPWIQRLNLTNSPSVTQLHTGNS